MSIRSIPTTSDDLHGEPRPVLLAVVVVLTAAVLLSLVAAEASDLGSVALPVVTVGSFLGVGCVILLRARWHRIGWLLVGAAVAYVVTDVEGVPILPLWYSGWVGNWSSVAFFSLLAITTMTFPTGRLPTGTGLWARSTRWVTVLLPVLVVMAALVRQPLDAQNDVVVPYGFLPSWVWVVGIVVAAGSLLVGGASLVFRLRRSSGELRARLAWVVSALALVAVAVAATFGYLLVSAVLGRPDPGEDVWWFAASTYLTLPLAFMVATLRYRLYDIDRLISRTVSYSLVVAMLATVFAAITVALPQLLRLPDDVPLLVAAATLAIAALFNPLRLRVQASVDRRFNRARYDAAIEVDRFADRLRVRSSLTSLSEDVVEVVVRTMQPASVSVWIRRDG